MPQTIDGPDSVAARANELYWSGGMTVDDIVEQLGISRTALYSAIEPAPAGLICADCQVRMVHTNRTMRDRGIALCPNCGRESEPGEAGAFEAPEPRSGDSPGAEPGAQPGTDQVWGGRGEQEVAAGEPFDLSAGLARWGDTLKSVPPQRLALVGGGAALGIMLGALAAHALREGR